jgi:hypothetical protein
MEEAQMIVMKIYSQDLARREADSRGLAASASANSTVGITTSSIVFQVDYPF